MGDDLIFDGSQMTAVAHMTDSPTVVVVFDENHGRDPGDFEGRDVYVRNGVSVIGVTTSSWFPQDEMEDIVRTIRARVGGRRLVTLGHHIGGYAALRYSSALGADLSIGIAPRFCRDGAAGTEAGRPIQYADISGTALIVIDPCEEPDRQHASAIASATTAEIVPARFGWGAPQRFFEEDNADDFAQFLASTTHIESQDLRKCIRATRRKSWYYNHVLFGVLLERFEKQGDFRNHLHRSVLDSPHHDYTLTDALLTYLDGQSGIALRKLLSVVDNPHALYDATRFWNLYRKHKWYDGALFLARRMSEGNDVESKVRFIYSIMDLRKSQDSISKVISVLSDYFQSDQAIAGIMHDIRTH